MSLIFDPVRITIPSLVIALLFSTTPARSGPVTPLRMDERIVLYPAIAWPVGADRWQAEVQGRVFEPERRRASTAALRKSLGLSGVKLSPEQEHIFNERARLFLVDHERGKALHVRVGTNAFSLGQSRADGSFSGRIEFAAATPGRENSPRSIATAIALVPTTDSRHFAGEIFPLAAQGVSVISDIDDTNKLTEVRERQAMLRNTFLSEFAPVPGMAGFYQALAQTHAATFHYISASPWQLYEPLASLVNDHGFPAGTFSLKPFRWKSRSFLSLFADPVKYKLSVIEPFLQRFPGRRFILIGDSGERDPEIYGELARRFPAQIERIYIRDVTDENAEAERFAHAFREIPRSRWQIFREPAGLHAELNPRPHERR